jgi:WhiB family redox-sensing transcriptional regulator
MTAPSTRSRQVSQYRHPTQRNIGYNPRADAVTLLAEILRGTPPLPGAACVGQGDLFDYRDDENHAKAITLCQRCPALDACRQWADSQPRAHISGVVAGEIRKPVIHRDTRGPYRPKRGTP